MIMPLISNITINELEEIYEDSIELIFTKNVSHKYTMKMLWNRLNEINIMKTMKI